MNSSKFSRKPDRHNHHSRNFSSTHTVLPCINLSFLSLPIQSLEPCELHLRCWAWLEIQNGALSVTAVEPQTLALKHTSPSPAPLVLLQVLAGPHTVNPLKVRPVCCCTQAKCQLRFWANTSRSTEVIQKPKQVPSSFDFYAISKLL